MVQIDQLPSKDLSNYIFLCMESGCCLTVSNVLFQSGDFQLELCVNPNQIAEALIARAKFYEAAGEAIVSDQGDEFDYQKNAKIAIVRREGEIIGTIRNLVFSLEYDFAPCLLSIYFPQSLQILGTAKASMLESSRFAIAANLDRKSAFTVQGLLFRFQSISTYRENVDYATALVRPRHAKFYEKYMNMGILLEDLHLYGVKLSFIAGPAPTPCFFSYSLPEKIGIHMETSYKKYHSLKERLMDNF